MQIFKRNKGPQPDEAEAQDARRLPRRLRVLVVDENPTVRAVTARRLSHLGYDVALAENGFVTLNILVTSPFDIILLDMGMTLLSGVATMKKIRASGMAGNAAFVMITGRSDSLAAVEALNAGADDLVVKPFDFDVLDVRLRHVSARAETLGALDRHNAELDARIARRAVELGETREALRDMQTDRARLISSIQALHDEVERLNAAQG